MMNCTITSTPVKRINIIFYRLKRAVIYGLSDVITATKLQRVSSTLWNIMVRLLIVTHQLYLDTCLAVVKILQIAKIVTPVLTNVIASQNTNEIFNQEPEYHSLYQSSELLLIYPGKVAILHTHMTTMTNVQMLATAHFMILIFVTEIQVGVREHMVALYKYFIPKSHD